MCSDMWGCAIGALGGRWCARWYWGYRFWVWFGGEGGMDVYVHRGFFLVWAQGPAQRQIGVLQVVQ